MKEQLCIKKGVQEDRVKMNAAMHEINGMCLQTDVNIHEELKMILNCLSWKVDDEDFLDSQIKMINKLESLMMGLCNVNSNIRLEDRRRDADVKDDVAIR
jgi:hypothetical protein